ncbi:hypothetical protein NC652_036435 [Populus alba x Populus x berolinensis]|nr:hypothetical protein NC652_036435 [Populus alba x Populus x berolinensis]
MGQLHKRLGLCLVAARRFNKPSIMPPLHPGRRAQATLLSRGYKSPTLDIPTDPILGCKRSKITAPVPSNSTTLNFVHISEEGDTPTIKALRRQYLMRSRAATTSDAILLEKQKLKGLVVVPMSMSSSDDIAPSSTF